MFTHNPVGARLVAPSGAVVDRDYARGFLGLDVAPGGWTDVAIRMTAPVTPGLYGLVFDPVDEYVAWFENFGSRVVVDYLHVEGASLPPDSRAPGSLQCRIATTPHAAAGRIVAALTNTGDTTWLVGPLVVPGEVQLGIQALRPDGSLVTRDWRRVPLPRCVPPGDAVTVTIDFAQERAANVGRVRLDMVAEGLTWFEDRGNRPVVLDVPTR